MVGSKQAPSRGQQQRQQSRQRHPTPGTMLSDSSIVEGESPTPHQTATRLDHNDIFYIERAKRGQEREPERGSRQPPQVIKLPTKPPAAASTFDPPHHFIQNYDFELRANPRSTSAIRHPPRRGRQTTSQTATAEGPSSRQTRPGSNGETISTSRRWDLAPGPPDPRLTPCRRVRRRRASLAARGARALDPGRAVPPAFATARLGGVAVWSSKRVQRPVNQGLAPRRRFPGPGSRELRPLRLAPSAGHRAEQLLSRALSVGDAAGTELLLTPSGMAACQVT